MDGMHTYSCDYCDTPIVNEDEKLCPACEMPHGLGGPDNDDWISEAYEDPRPWMTPERKREYNRELENQ